MVENAVLGAWFVTLASTLINMTAGDCVDKSLLSVLNMPSY
jgi:hypothetical protein